MNNKPTKWTTDPWGWVQVTAGIVVLALAFLWPAQPRSQMQTVAQFLAMSAIFALVLAGYHPEQRRVFTRVARGIGLVCLVAAFVLLFLV